MPRIDEFGHPLFGAHLRLRRARNCIGTLKRQMQRWSEAHREQFRVEVDAQSRRVRITPVVPEERHMHLPRMSVTIGETAYHTRSALDYLVYSIARGNNGGTHVGGTQFPIEDVETVYWSRWTGKDPKTGRGVARYLKKIPKPVADDLFHYQPFSGCRWTEMLRDLSNPDKHRQLTTLTTYATFRPHGGNKVLGVMDPNTGLETVHLSGEVQVVVELEGGEEIVGAFQLIEREARALIRSYAGRFQFDPTRFV